MDARGVVGGLGFAADDNGRLPNPSDNFRFPATTSTPRSSADYARRTSGHRPPDTSWQTAGGGDRGRRRGDDADIPVARLAGRPRTGDGWRGLYRNLADYRTMSARELAHLGGLADAVAPAPVVWVPFLSTDVHDIAGMGGLAPYLFSR